MPDDSALAALPYFQLLSLLDAPQNFMDRKVLLVAHHFLGASIIKDVVLGDIEQAGLVEHRDNAAVLGGYFPLKFLGITEYTYVEIGQEIRLCAGRDWLRHKRPHASIQNAIRCILLAPGGVELGRGSGGAVAHVFAVGGDEELRVDK